METSSQRLLAWCGPVLMAIFFVGIWPIAGFVPPPSPNNSVEQVTSFYAENATTIRLGLYICMIAAALVAPWVAAITMQLLRIDRPLALVHVILGLCIITWFVMPLMTFQAAAYRPEAAPEVTYRLNDYGWLLFVGISSTPVLQAFVIALVIFKDKREVPIFPRWVAYASIWCGLGMAGGGLCVFVKNGPLAWNGVISWWLLLVAFGTWVLVLSLSLLRYAIPHEEQELARESGHASV